MKWTELLPDDSIIKCKSILAYVQKEREQGKIICPPQNQIFRALELTPPDNVKVCIIGQDPYHTPGQANGLAFSINNGNPIQPSLYNIFKELVSDINCKMPTTTDLSPWAKNGVLLLNATLTVESGKANSHFNLGWSLFTTEILRVCSNLDQPIVFLVWGKFAQNIIYQIFQPDTDWDTMKSDRKKACVFSAHPSPLSASKGFFGSKPFSTANEILKSFNTDPINWELE